MVVVVLVRGCVVVDGEVNIMSNKGKNNQDMDINKKNRCAVSSLKE